MRHVRADVQPVVRRHGVGDFDPDGAAFLCHTHAARVVDRKVGMKAEVRHLDAGLTADLQYV